MESLNLYNLKAIGNRFYYYFYNDSGICLGKLDLENGNTLYEIRMINSINGVYNKVFSTNKRKGILKLSCYLLFRRIRERTKDTLFKFIN